MKHFDAVSVGTALQDITFYTKDGEIVPNPSSDPTKLKLIGFEYGAKVHSDEVSYSFGGGAANTATGMARLGLHNAVLASLGKDAIGESIAAALRNEGVDDFLIQYNREYRSGFSFLLVEKSTNEHVVFAYYGANKYLQITPKTLRGFRTDWFYVSSLSQSNWPNAMRTLTTRKSKIAWNPGAIQLNQPKVVTTLLPHIELLILNKDEATELALHTAYRLRKKNAEAPISELSKHLHSLGPALVLITNGRHGSHVFDGSNMYFAKPSPDKPKDTTGAGDCFGSTFTTGLINFSNDINKALQLAVINATALVAHTGAQHGLLTWKKATTTLKKITR